MKKYYPRLRKNIDHNAKSPKNLRVDRTNLFEEEDVSLCEDEYSDMDKIVNNYDGIYNLFCDVGI